MQKGNDQCLEESRSRTRRSRRKGISSKTAAPVDQCQVPRIICRMVVESKRNCIYTVTNPVQYLHGESFVYPVVTTLCSKETVQNSVEFKQAYMATTSFACETT